MWKNNIIDIKLSLFLFIKLIVFLLLNNHIKGNCPLEKPVMILGGECKAIPCSKSSISNGACTINNYIISIQWLSNIIVIAETGYQFVSAATFFNGDLILETIKYNNNTRYFYGLRKNGYTFNGNSILKVDNNNDYDINPYFNIFTVITENNEKKKEYLVLISNKKNKIELYDFDNSLTYTQEIPGFGSSFSNYKFMSFKIKDIDNDIIYTIFATTLNGYFYLFKLNVIYSNANEPILQLVAQSSPYVQSGLMVSCFETDNQKIICFYLGNSNYKIIVFNYNFQEEINSDLLPSTSTNTFFKCVHIKGDIGAFLIFTSTYPKIFFKEYKNGNFEDLGDVILNYELKEKHFIDSFDYNDFIKISDNKISFIGFMDDIGYLFVVLLEFIEPNKDIIIRYYSMDLKNLHHLENIKDLKAHNYNNYISLIFNAKNMDIDKEDKNSINFLIFSYPSMNDTIIDLEEYIISHDNLNVYKFETNLTEFVIIENNIFGFILSEIKILSIEGCGMFNITLQPKNEPLNNNYILEKDEEIKLILLNKYKPFKCEIKYIVSATELDYEKSKDFPIHEEKKTNSVFNEESYNEQRGTYQGKIGIYSIQLIYNLSHVCEDNCKLCSIFSNMTMANCLICKYDSEILNKKEKICFGKNESKSIDEILDSLDNLMKESDPEQSYIISGAGYTVLIKDIDEYIEDSTVNIDFAKCEQKLKASLPENTKLRMLQLNLEKEGEGSFIDQVEYRIYDEHGNLIDLTPCNDIEINIEYEITDLSKLDLDLISKFKDLGVDVFNIKDEFFNDICRPYSDDESNSDMILSDRVSDIYQNISLCDGDCDYESFNLEKMSINCKCEVKQELSIEPEKANFASSITSAFLDSNFGIVKCYELVFSFTGKLKNAGFWIFSILIISQFAIYVKYCLTGIVPIQNYIEKEMLDNGYIVKEIGNNKGNNKGKNNRKKTENKNIKKKNNNFPPKKKAMEMKNKIKWLKNPFDKMETVNTNGDNDLGKKDYDDKKTEVIDTFGRDFKKINDNGKYKFVKGRNRFKKGNNMIANTLGSKDVMNINEEIKINKIKKLRSNDIQEVDHLIFINAKNTDIYVPWNSNYNLDNYDYDEAILYEDRNFFRIFFIYLMSKESILNTFYYKQPLELVPLRILIFIFSNSCDIALNCLFYLSDNISDKYHYEGKSAILFSLTNNITISLVSSIVGYCLIYFSQSLVQSTDKITILFRNEEDHLKKDKKYKVKTEKNMDILKEIKKILKCLKLKIILFLIFEFLFMLFFFYYVTAFCHVYNSTQTSWLLDTLTSYGISLITAFVLSFIMSILYEIAVKCEFKMLYKITLFIYNGI